MLRATEQELASCPLSRPLVVADIREVECEVILRGSLTPHLIRRCGWPLAGLRSRPPRPRRPISEIVDVPA